MHVTLTNFMFGMKDYNGGYNIALGTSPATDECDTSSIYSRR